MSRCFPFPPPGYEKKDIPDYANLLTKEKHKENKHKKDKDREKKEGKEKRVKKRGEEKQREKKDRKDKDKHKEKKDSDKEKKRTSNEKKIVRPPESHNGDELDPGHVQKNGMEDSKFLLELGKRTRDDDGAKENRTVQKPTPDQRNVELQKKNLARNIGNLAEGSVEFKNKREDNRNINVQSIDVQARGIENGFAQNSNAGHKRKVEEVARLVDKGVEMPMEGKEKSKPKSSDIRGLRNKDKDREKKIKSKDKKRKKKEEKAKAKEDQNQDQVRQRESSNNAVDIQSIKMSHLLEKSNRNFGSEGHLGKRKEPETNGFLHDKDTRPNKLPRPVTSSHQVVENGRKLEPCQTAIQFGSERKGTINNHKVNNKVLSSQPLVENGRQLKLCETAIPFASKEQGTVNEHKDNEKVSSCQPVLENGKKSESGQTAIQSASEKQRGVVCDSKMQKNESKINGLIEAQQPIVSSARPSSSHLQAKQKVEASFKPPHPDTKYLSEILRVPKIEWSDFDDDQEWLFSSNDLRSKTPKWESSVVEGTKQAWSEALHIESADVTALPYVIPY